MNEINLPSRNGYWLRFHKPVNGQRDYFFSCIAAAYEIFTPQQIGVSRMYLYVQEFPYTTRNCIVTKINIYIKPNKK